MAKKPLYAFTVSELEAELSKGVEHIHFSHNDIRIEIERRRQQKNADRTFYLTILALFISVVSLACSILVALFK